MIMTSNYQSSGKLKFDPTDDCNISFFPFKFNKRLTCQYSHQSIDNDFTLTWYRDIALYICALSTKIFYRLHSLLE